jgi:hypothetical protein
MQPTALLATALLVAGLAAPAAAEEVQRYQLEKTDSGYVRMDTTTGEMSICEEKANQLVCRAATEERAAFQDEIDRLQAKLDGLEDRVARLEARPQVPEALLPSDEEIDKSMDVMEKFFRRFMGIMKDIEKDDSGAQQKT